MFRYDTNSVSMFSFIKKVSGLEVNLLNKEAFAHQILFKERNQNLRVSILNVKQHNGDRQMMIKFRKFTVPIFCYLLFLAENSAHKT